MTFAITDGSAQTNGEPVALTTTAATVHTVPDGETHEISIQANATSTIDIHTIIDGVANEIVETLTAKQNRIVYTSVIKNDKGSDINVQCKTSSGTAVAFAKVVQHV